MTKHHAQLRCEGIEGRAGQRFCRSPKPGSSQEVTDTEAAKVAFAIKGSGLQGKQKQTLCYKDDLAKCVSQPAASIEVYWR